MPCSIQLATAMKLCHFVWQEISKNKQPCWKATPNSPIQRGPYSICLQLMVILQQPGWNQVTEVKVTSKVMKSACLFLCIHGTAGLYKTRVDDVTIKMIDIILKCSFVRNTYWYKVNKEIIKRFSLTDQPLFMTLSRHGSLLMWLIFQILKIFSYKYHLSTCFFPVISVIVSHYHETILPIGIFVP